MALTRIITCDICGEEYEGHSLDIRRLRLTVAVGPGVDGSPIIEADYCKNHGEFRIAYYLFKRLAKGDFGGVHDLIPGRWEED